ncbi:LysR substrate-binding domain-containing protein [Dechloromonas sp. ZY10]|uniref:LysR family transcriptional regulator n=1 Tax=Dechloromonas aquae TaxID=2664436 RepID=UPI003528CE2C
MELRQLRYFVAIATHGSLSQAAARLYVAQSALSHQLAQLENELGATLFDRLPRGVALTAAGRAFHAHAEAILRQVEAARASVRNEAATPAGKVIVGIPHSLSQALALPLLKAVRATLPQVELELTEELTGNLVPQLRAGQIDLAFLFADGTLDEFRHQPLLVEELLLISPPEQTPPQPLDLATALRQPLILPAAPHGVRPIIEAAARTAGLAAPNVVAEISSISILRTSLLAGLGHTLLPPMPLQRELAEGRLRAWPLANTPLRRQVELCSARHLPPTPAALAVAELCRTLARQLCTEGEWAGASSLDPGLLNEFHGRP